ncbi:MAG: hypothetical protein NTW50_05220 [Candidatus Berkelbacteria bacterium]|nr:hypothetical protein [Candidatus Berkelbacteria bacterium]
MSFNCENLTQNLNKVVKNLRGFDVAFKKHDVPTTRKEKNSLILRLKKYFAPVTFEKFRKIKNTEIKHNVEPHDLPSYTQKHQYAKMTHLDLEARRITISEVAVFREVTLQGAGSIYDFTIFADEKFAVTVGQGGEALIWSLKRSVDDYPEKPEPSFVLSGCEKNLWAVKVLKNGYIVSGNEGGQLAFWNIASPQYREGRSVKPCLKIQLPYPVVSLCELDEGKIAVGLSDATIRLVNLNNPKAEPVKIDKMCCGDGLEYAPSLRRLSAYSRTEKKSIFF